MKTALRQASLSSTLSLRLNFVVKRFFDICISLVAILVSAPFLILLGLIIKLTSTGSVLYTQKRAGHNGKWFFIYKFRTMRIGADKEDQMIFGKLKNDPRVTKIGLFLRKYSLDELPQLINVFLGHMSLVGPRPFIEVEANTLTTNQQQRLRVKPGITGYAQIHGRSNLTLKEIIEYDLYYVDNYSLTLDLAIISKTIPYVLLHKGAY